MSYWSILVLMAELWRLFSLVMQLYGRSTYLCSQITIICAAENQEVLVMYVTEHLYCTVA